MFLLSSFYCLYACKIFSCWPSHLSSDSIPGQPSLSTIPSLHCCSRVTYPCFHLTYFLYMSELILAFLAFPGARPPAHYASWDGHFLRSQPSQIPLLSRPHPIGFFQADSHRDWSLLAWNPGLWYCFLPFSHLLFQHLMVTAMQATFDFHVSNHISCLIPCL